MYTQASALRWRKEAGRLACLASGKGPTGGFCMGAAAPAAVRGNNYCLPAKLASRLGQLFAGDAVLDLGCGVGAYGAAFRRSAPSVRWVGVDGADGIEEHTHGRVRFAELTEGLPSDLRRPWAWKMSLEVAEHIPRAGEPVFVHSLLRDVTRGVVLSWARLNQSGLHHVNCQSAEYVQCAMSLAGFELDRELTQSLRDSIGTDGRHQMTAVCPWLKQTLFAFRPAAAASPRSLTLPPTPTTAFASRYLALTRDHCGHVPAGCPERTNAN